MKRDFDLKDRNFRDLCKVIAGLRSSEEVRSFLLDLCTPNEIQALADRWEVAVMIARGDSYREISKNTGISTATITRVGRFIRTGRGYQLALARFKIENPEDLGAQAQAQAQVQVQAPAQRQAQVDGSDLGGQS
ncbi:MAG: DNA-binding transcriptional regulator [Bdellovibrionales bacterium]|nr:DNA-binding transcriptional regulator [Bdellovibrionales bacterium]